MSSKNPTPQQVTSPGNALTSPIDIRSRRGSNTSTSAISSQADKEQLAQALDKIHTSAAQRNVLTTFNDLEPPRDESTSPESKGLAGELAQNGFSGLYSRFKEAVGVSSKEKAAVATTTTDEVENADASSRKASGTAANASKTSASTFARVDTGLTHSTFTSNTSDPAATTVGSSSAVLTSEGQSQQAQSTKASSVTASVSATAATASSSSKAAQSGRQVMPNVAKATATVAPVTVSAFKEPTRSTPTRPEDSQVRPGAKTTSQGRTSDASIGHSVPGQDVSVSGQYAVHSGTDPKLAPILDKISIPNRSRREDSISVDGNADSPLSPVKVSVTQSSIASQTSLGLQDCSRGLAPMASMASMSSTSRLSAFEGARRPLVIDRISQSRPSANHSRSSSMSQGTAEASTITTSAHRKVHHESFNREDGPQRMRSGKYKIPGTTTDEGAPDYVNAKLEHMRKLVLSKDFWMADDKCKECFSCGVPFSAFRRKHHCRTCGCIFDSGCTSTISGQKFGVHGTLRVCKRCLRIMNQRHIADGDMSDDSASADDSYLPAIFRPSKSAVSDMKVDRNDARTYERTAGGSSDIRVLSTPMMAIPATRRTGDPSNRNSAILEIDAPQLSRPSSSRSLRTAAGRPQSSGHRRHHSKHNFLTRFKSSPATDARAPFRRSANEEVAKKSSLPAFHDDNVIDPDLAPFMSDESSGDEQMSIFSTMASNDPRPASFEHDRTSFSPYVGSTRKHKHRTHAEKSATGFNSFSHRGMEEGSVNLHHRSSRRRNLSTASTSLHHIRSPRPKSSHLKGPSASTDTLGIYDSPGPAYPARLTRSSSMRGENEPRLELNPTSLLHVRKLLKQLLEDSQVPNVSAWEKALIPILLKCTTSVDPDAENGDSIDIRHYVKLKKIPGGRPGDTSYVSGVVFTKKLALKSMPRRLTNPSVVIVSFPIEYQRHQQHFMSLQPVIDEEIEFLKMITNRLLARKPQVVLCEKAVSNQALQYFSEANVAVAYNVKPSVLSAVSRCLETQIISSIDMLSLPPENFQVGKSSGFQVKTYVNDEIPGRKKTYIFLSGSQDQLGCTIALRGAPTHVLSQMKRITEFMVYVVYNLKLECCLMHDSNMQMPRGEEMLGSSGQIAQDSCSTLNVNAPPPAQKDARQRNSSLLTIELEQNQDSGKPSVESETGETTPNVATPTNAAAGLESGLLQPLQDGDARASHESLVPDDVPMPTYYSDMVANYKTKILSASPFVRFSEPYLLMKAREQERRLAHLKRLRDQNIIEERADGEKPKPQKFQLIKPQMVHQTGQIASPQIMEVLHAVHDAEYDKALYNYQTHTRQWESHIQGNLDLFDPYAHQNIVVLHSVVCTETKIPCIEPALIAIAFYDEHAQNSGVDPDCTLGQYVEDVCYGADALCSSNSCDRKMSQHHRTYVHGEARVTVFIEQLPKDQPPLENITMWNYCKVCKRETDRVEMSKGTWKYSFGKYLELAFWGRGTWLAKGDGYDAWECSHDHHRDHIRYFGLSDKIIRIHYDPIDLLEIIVPRARITWKVEHDLNLKNEIFTSLQDRWARFTTSVKARLKAIKPEAIPADKAEACRLEIDKMNKKVQDEHVSLTRKLQEAYMNSKYYEVIPLNVILREMVERVTEWDAAFGKFETDFLPTEKDIRRLTMQQLRKMFTDPSKESLATTEANTEATDFTEKPSQNTQTSVSDETTKMKSQPTDSDLSQPGTMLESGLQSIMETPIATPGAVERVDPLDLATPATGLMAVENSQTTPKLPPQLPPTGSPVPTPPVLLTPAPVPETTDSPTDPTPTSPTKDRVEELRQLQQDVVLAVASGSNSDQSTPEGEPKQQGSQVKTPDMDRGLSRKAGLHVSPPLTRAISQPLTSLPGLPRTQSGLGKKMFGLGKDKDRTLSGDGSSSTEMRRTPTSDSLKSEKKLFGLRSRASAKSSIPRFVGGKRKDTRVTTLARHFEQLSREFEKERKKDEKQRAAKMFHSRAFLQRSSAKATVQVFDDPDEAVDEPAPAMDEPPVRHLDESKHVGPLPTETETSTDISQPTNAPSSPPAEARQCTAEDNTGDAEGDENTHNHSLAASDDEQADSDTEHSLLEGSALEEIAESLDSSTEIPLELPKQDKMNFMKVLTNLWAERSASEWPALDYPLNATDHIFIDSDIIVREDEPSSLIAFALDSRLYRTQVSKFHRRKSVEPPSAAELPEKDVRAASGCSCEDSVRDEALQKSLLRESGKHLKYQFNEGSAKMLVKIFYAEHFDALRRRCGVADRIIESLSRCLKFDSKGGKTKSVFLKTKDDRFMMKSLSPIETSAFLKFAGPYFGIMAEALFRNLPSVIAKMLGFFQVIIKNPVTNTEIKLDLLLMENLFYDRAPTRIFDLKGSMRNRKIQSTGEQNEVLLDENMVEYIYESPLFAREHSKRLLSFSVWNDTLFLAQQNVMDYSLMIAVDEAKKELVVGIIDCIRTYTWDKTIESWIKGRGFAGGGRNRPTVTSPKEYKSRFREAMARYILQAPNCWHQFAAPRLQTRPHLDVDGTGDETTVTEKAI